MIKNNEISIFQKILQAIFTPKFSFRNVFISLVLGVLVAYLTLGFVYGFNDANYIVSEIIKGDFSSTKSGAKLTDKIVILGFAGMSVLIGSKAGMLNIGVSGQMMFGAFVGYLAVRQFNMSNVWLQLFVGLIVTMVASAFIATISGILKSIFKVNEVITTIMMNWIIVYLLKFMASIKNALWFNSDLSNQIQMDFSNSEKIPDLQWSAFNKLSENPWILTAIGLSLFIISCLFVWLLLYKTRFGAKIKSVGKNPSTSKYAGYNVPRIQTISMAISGLFAGMAGYVMYFISSDIIIVGSMPINEGFAGIAVALVALNNPLALIGSALVFGILDGPTNGIVFGGFPSQLVQIFSGIITYFVAASTMWIYLRPIEKFKTYRLRNMNIIEKQIEIKVVKQHSKTKIRKTKAKEIK